MWSQSLIYERVVVETSSARMSIAASQAGDSDGRNEHIADFPVPNCELWPS